MFLDGFSSQKHGDVSSRQFVRVALEDSFRVKSNEKTSSLTQTPVESNDRFPAVAKRPLRDCLVYFQGIVLVLLCGKSPDSLEKQ